MIIEAGKYYRTTGGYKAFVGYIVSELAYCSKPIQGHIESNEGIFSHTREWNLNGTCCNDFNYDLTEEWIDLKFGEMYMNIYSKGTDLFKSKNVADALASDDILARIKIKWVEGQFDD